MLTKKFMDDCVERIHFRLDQFSYVLPAEAFLAGGFVRDAVLIKPYRDIDVFSSGTTPKTLPPHIDWKHTCKSPEEVLKTFMMSLNQCAYAHKTGLVLSADFVKTLETRHVTMDANIPNWNDAQVGRKRSHHYDKMVERFPEFTFDPIPEPKKQYALSTQMDGWDTPRTTGS